MTRSEVRHLARKEFRRQLRRLAKIMRREKCHRWMRHCMREARQ